MDYLQRIALSQIMKNKGCGIPAKQMCSFADDLPNWLKNGGIEPKYKSTLEQILIGKYGTTANLVDTWYSDSTGSKKQMVVGRYNSGVISRLIKESNAETSESDIISQIHVVKEGCDLRETTAISLPNLREIGGTLTLNTSSSLEKLDGLKSVKKINVVAKNLKDMDEYLIKLGILTANDKNIRGNLRIADDIYLIIKNYL